MVCNDIWYEEREKRREREGTTKCPSVAMGCPMLTLLASVAMGCPMLTLRASVAMGCPMLTLLALRWVAPC